MQQGRRLPIRSRACAIALALLIPNGVVAAAQTQHPESKTSARQLPADEACIASRRAEIKPVSDPDNELFRVIERGKTGYIDQKGNIRIPLCFEEASEFSDDLAVFRRDGKWGYIDASANVVIQPRFSLAHVFHEGLARVQPTGKPLDKEAKWGFIDKTGKMVIAPTINGEDAYSGDYFLGFHEGRAAIKSPRFPGLFGFIDKRGNQVIPAKFPFADVFYEGLALVRTEDQGKSLWGYIDTEGKWAIPPRFESASPFSEHLAAIKLDGRCDYIDHSGAVVIQIPPVPAPEDCDDRAGDFSEGLAHRRVGGLSEFINHTGNVVIPPKFHEGSIFSDGLAVVRTGVNTWGYIDKTGKVVLQVQTIFRPGDFHHGLAALGSKLDGSIGYMDKTGVWVWVTSKFDPEPPDKPDKPSQSATPQQ